MVMVHDETMSEVPIGNGCEAMDCSPSYPPSNILWCFSQVKGSNDGDEVTDADILTTVEFNHDGELLATGDKGGRIVIFKRNPSVPAKFGEYIVYSTFQSHEPEFDYLKSIEIEEKINKIKWLPQHNLTSHYLLSTNDKTIKLWKIQEKDRRTVGFNLRNEDGSFRPEPNYPNQIVLPRYVPMDLMVEASPRRIFSNAHSYHINSISLSSDYETFISADDLRINLWNMSITDQSFNIVDIKPANMEELTEVITAAEFHPYNSFIFVYSSSRGSIRLCDMRERALCDQHSKMFEEPEDPFSKSFFSEIISSVADVSFSHSGQYMVTRDYLTVKIWDLRRENAPVQTFLVHEYLRGKLCSLYENDCIFDKFECSWNHDDTHLMTGSYHNFFRIFDVHNTKKDLMFEASREYANPRTALTRRYVVSSGAGPQKTPGKTPKDAVNVDNLVFGKRILHSTWHPSENVMAVAATNNLYLFAGDIENQW